jgi:hypothetical protein
MGAKCCWCIHKTYSIICVDRLGERKFSPYYSCFEDANTLYKLIEEKSPQGWGLERNEIT